MNRLFCLLISWVIALGVVVAQQRQNRFDVTDTRVYSPIERTDESVAKAHLHSLNDSLTVSILTCSPGQEAYTMFGHTAIRIVNRNHPDMDVAFNYGMFNYNSKNFIYRFVKGETDYELGAEPTQAFLSRYSERGYTVYEQVLRMNTHQKNNVLLALLENYKPENRVYRYNFLYDNCTSRAQKVILNALDDSSLDWNMFPVIQPGSTFRNLLHIYTKNSPWTEFGIDMVLGSEVDQPVNAVNCTFLPLLFKQLADSTLIHFPKAEVVSGTRGTQYFVKQIIEYHPKGKMEDEAGFPLTPMATFTVLLLVALILSGWNLYHGNLSYWFDIILYACQGIAGIVVAFLFFFSEHPAVGSNWLVLSFNPLALLPIPNVVYQQYHKGGPLVPFYGIDLLECVNLTGLLITVYIYFAPTQWMNPAMLPLVLTLLVRSLLHFVHRTRQLYFNKKKSAEMSWRNR